jgi:hypothetical protein
MGAGQTGELHRQNDTRLKFTRKREGAKVKMITIFTAKTPRRQERQKRWFDLQYFKKYYLSVFLVPSRLRGGKFPWFLLLPVGLGIAGCHPAAIVLPSYIQSIGVDTVQNETSYYSLDTLFQQDIIRQLQVDGRLSLADPDKADLTIKVVVHQYNIVPVSFDPKTNFPLQYMVTITYDVAAIDNREKRTILEDDGKSHSIYYYTPQSGGPAQTEDQANAQLVDDASYLLVRRVLEGF